MWDLLCSALLWILNVPTVYSVIPCLDDDEAPLLHPLDGLWAARDWNVDQFFKFSESRISGSGAIFSLSS